MEITARLARASARHPWLVLVLWLAAVAASVAALLLVGSSMVTKVGASGSESARAEQLAKRLSNGGTHDGVVVRSKRFRLHSAQFQAELKAIHDRLEKLGAKVVPAATPSGAGHAALVLFEVRHASPGAVVHAIGELNGGHGFDAGVYGPHFCDRDFHAAAAADLRTGEEYGIAAALVLLLLVFGTVVAALLPLVLGLVATLVGLGVLQAVSQAIQLSVFSRNIVAGM